MSEITIGTFAPFIESNLSPPLFLVKKEEQADTITVEIRHPQPRKTTESRLLQSISRLFQEQATDEIREVLTQELVYLAKQTVFHSNYLLTACLTKEKGSRCHHALLYVKEKEMFHHTITSDDDVIPFIEQMNQLIRGQESD
jgi:hypothetical protein